MNRNAKLSLVLPFIALCLTIFALFALRLFSSMLVMQIYAGLIVLVLITGLVAGILALRKNTAPAIIGLLVNGGLLLFLVFFSFKAVHNL